MNREPEKRIKEEFKRLEERDQLIFEAIVRLVVELRKLRK